MSGKTAAIIGVTGLVGSELLSLIIKDPYFSTVRVLVRRPYAKPDPKVEVKLVDFSDAESFKLALEGVQVIFSCIGTTQKKVKGDKEAYRKIDFDIPANAARFGKEAGACKFIMVSSVGANRKSRNFYLKLKGEVEKAVEASGISSIHFVQPSVMTGERKEKRPGEKLMQQSMKFISGLLVRGWTKYRAISGAMVAKAMLALSKQGGSGVYRLEYERIRRLAEYNLYDKT